MPADAAPEDEPGRRTQKDRREATIGRLIGATIDAICDVGYARTSLGEICTRAGISKGGLFRHFDSRLALIVAAADEVADRHLASFAEQMAGGPDPDLRTALAFMRERHRADVNVVWFELLVAARTDPDLRTALAPITDRFYASIDALAAAVPHLAHLDTSQRHLLVSFARSFFDGETIARLVVPEPEVEERRLALLADMADLTLLAAED